MNKNTILGYCSHCHGLVICDVGARADEAVATEASVAARWLNVHRDLSHWITIAARAASRNVQRSVCAWPAAQPSGADAHRYTKTGLCHDRRGPFWGRAPARDSTGRERHSSRDCLPAIFISGRAQVAELGRLVLGPGAWALSNGDPPGTTRRADGSWLGIDGLIFPAQFVATTNVMLQRPHARVQMRMHGQRCDGRHTRCHMAGQRSASPKTLHVGSSSARQIRPWRLNSRRPRVGRFGWETVATKKYIRR